MSMAALRGKLDCCCCCSCFSGDPFYKSDLNNCFPVLVSPVFSGWEKKGFASIISFLQEKKEEKKYQVFKDDHLPLGASKNIWSFRINLIVVFASMLQRELSREVKNSWAGINNSVFTRMMSERPSELLISAGDMTVLKKSTQEENECCFDSLIPLPEDLCQYTGKLLVKQWKPWLITVDIVNKRLQSRPVS